LGFDGVGWVSGRTSDLEKPVPKNLCHLPEVLFCNIQRKKTEGSPANCG